MDETREQVVRRIVAEMLAEGKDLTNKGVPELPELNHRLHAVDMTWDSVKSDEREAVVEAIELSGPERLQFERRKKALQPLDAEGYSKLGAWLKSKHQHDMAQEYFQNAVKIDADLHSARRELGEVKKDGKWSIQIFIGKRPHIIAFRLMGACPGVLYKPSEWENGKPLKIHRMLKLNCMTFLLIWAKSTTLRIRTRKLCKRCRK